MSVIIGYRPLGSRAVPRATLYVIPGSHPSMTARLMLERKGIDYRRVDLMPVIAKACCARFGSPE
jgi:hypothetical protein